MFDVNNIIIYKWDELYYIELENEIGVDAFKKLITNQEESLLSTQTKFKDLIKSDKELASLEDIDKGSYYRASYEREEIAIEELQRQQRYSICLSVFSFYEGRLKSICNQIEKKFNFKIKINDLNSNDDLMKYWNYLEKVFEINTDKISSLFTPIKQQKIVRNIIAHQEGIANEDQLKKINIINGLGIKKFGLDHQIQIVEISYLFFLIEKITLFFKELLLSIDVRHKEIME